ncbi:MAG: SulP family inorganic anion transporter [Leptolyngbyaceae bacterium]|nr:SulP family inorganic anion transporter [Leptolyngbyaceae bacterium]
MSQSSAPSSPFLLRFQQLQSWFQAEVLLSSIAAGGVTGIIGVIRAISYASLIFAGSLAIHLPIGLGMTVFSTAIAMGVVALTSTLPGMIATPLAPPVTMLAIAAEGISEELTPTAADDILPTVLVAIAVTSLFTGVLLLVLGILRQGERIRVIPYPVIGGFMAGTGWLLTKGFFQITTDNSLNWSSLLQLGQPAMLWRWLPGFGFAIAILVATKIWKPFWVLPTVLLACTISFFGLLRVSHISIDAARDLGWLLGPFPEGDGLWQPITPALFSQVHWWAIAHNLDSLLTVTLVSALSLLLSNSSIELSVGRDLDLSSEMKSVGIANITAGLLGGMVGSQAFPSTLLVHNIGASYRLTGLIAMVPSIAALAFGSKFLSYLPKAVLGSLILYLGLSLLWKWLYESYGKLPLSDYLTVWATLVVINGFGFLQGIAVGFVITVILFMYRYSQVDVAKQVFSGRTSRSNVGRTAAQDAILQTQGDQIYVLELQGFLFFGTANYLLTKARDRATTELPQLQLKESDQQPAQIVDQTVNLPLRYLIIDFRQVIGLDSSAVLTFNRILRLADQCQFTLVLTNLLPELEAELGQGITLESKRCQIFPDLDRGLEWCEQQILQEHHALTLPPSTLAEHLEKRFLTPEQTKRFMPYLTAHCLPAGNYLFHQGELRRQLYFIESGQVSVLLELEDGRTKRLQTCSSGQLLGEMRFFEKMPLSTSVRTDTDCTVYSLSRDAFDQMQQDAPDLIRALQRHIVELLCESLIRRGEQIRVMQ